jgi:hypothetical protein
MRNLSGNVLEQWLDVPGQINGFVGQVKGETWHDGVPGCTWPT